MSDDIDLMTALELREAERFAASLREQRAKKAPVLTHCVDCGETLEDHRKDWGRCFPCAARYERRGY